MAECPRCQRPVALARRTCLYCGAPLPAGGPAAAPPAEDAPALLLLDRGPMARQYQTSTWSRLNRLHTATLEAGHRLHLHRRQGARPLELDVASFVFGQTPLLGSSLLELVSWIDAIAPAVP